MIPTRGRQSEDVTVLEMPFGEPFERRPSFHEREPIHIIGTAAKKIERKEYRGCFRGKTFDAARRRVNALQKIIERKAITDWNNQLTIKRKLHVGQAHGRDRNFGKVPDEISSGFGLHPKAIPASDQEATKAIPLGLILPLGSSWQFVDRAGLHGEHECLPFCQLPNWNFNSTVGFLFLKQSESIPVVKKLLARYHAKRDFEKTGEPRGTKRVKSSKRLRFVIQKHAASRLHYDLRLEIDGVFKSWAVTKGPSLDPSDKRLAVEVEDHPLDYGDFEGTIPKGQYGGGTVMLWDRGYWECEDPQQSYRKGKLDFIVDGTNSPEAGS